MQARWVKTADELWIQKCRHIPTLILNMPTLCIVHPQWLEMHKLNASLASIKKSTADSLMSL